MAESALDLLIEHAPDFPRRHAGKIVTDTTQFMDIGYGDVIRLEGRHFLVLRDEMERRFGLEDPKYWVKRCRELAPDARRILKLEFYENFPVRIGSMDLTCYRSPKKESRILELVRGDPRFMQGETIHDAAGKNVRILDIVDGRRLDDIVENIEADHETYFFRDFPDILRKFIDACEAIAFLHDRLEKHGDIRRDHLYVAHGSGEYVWIDFDYTFEFHESPFGFDIFGLGNILLFLAGKGMHTHQSVGCIDDGKVTACLAESDFSLLFANRLVNLKKLFPYVPEELNRVLLKFSIGTTVFYESVREFMDELSPCVGLLQR